MKTEEKQKRIKRSTLIVSTIACFLSPYLGSAVNVCLPAMQQDLSIDAVLLSWITTSLCPDKCHVRASRSARSRISGEERKSLATGIGLIMISSFLCPFAGTAGVMIALRVFQGIGGGLVSVAGLAIVSSVFSPEGKGKGAGNSDRIGLRGPVCRPFLQEGFLPRHSAGRAYFCLPR